MSIVSENLVTLGRKPQSKRGLPTNGDGPRVYIETYGCQMNVADSALMAGALADQGYVKTLDASDADVILLNTCAVRERAEERVIARAKELASHKKKKHVVLAIAGCMAEHLKESLAERAPDVDVIAGPDSYRRLPDLLDQARVHEDIQTPFIDVKLDKGEVYEGLSGAAQGDGVSGFVSIQRGCDKFCTFCVVPFTRGRERGVPPREVLRHVRAYADLGYKEINLLGQTVNSYHYEGITFAELLRTLTEVDGIERIRFTSPYPVDFNDDVVDAMASSAKLSKYIHLPLQSGSDAVLERMRRGYTRADFLSIVDRLRRAMPDIAMSTDILSGFSGESEEDHQMTLEIMREIRFDSAFMFSYSERELTYASKKLADDVSPEVKKRRLKEIIQLQSGISQEVFTKQIGRTERVLIHGTSKRDEGQWKGRTDAFKTVIFDKSEGSAIGDLVDVTLTGATMATLFGRAAAP